MGGVWNFLITLKAAAAAAVVAVVVDVDVDEDEDEVVVGTQTVMNAVNLVILPESVDYALGIVV